MPGLVIDGIDITAAVVNAEYRLTVLERILQRLTEHVPQARLSSQEIAQIHQEVLKDMQTRYPSLGLIPKPEPRGGPGFAP